jgi:hypothetical protein
MMRNSAWGMPGRILRRGLCIALLAGVAGCADGPNSPYPSLAQINPLGRVLSPEEQEKARKDLEREQQTQRREAEQEIEKR